MTKNPERRKSQLSGLSAVPAPNSQEPQRDVAPSTQTNPRPMPVEGSERPKTRLAYYATDEEGQRIRAAFVAGQSRYGWRSFTDFQLDTMLARVRQIEAEINNGEPFPGVPPKGGPVGRPLDR